MLFNATDSSFIFIDRNTAVVIVFVESHNYLFCNRRQLITDTSGNMKMLDSVSYMFVPCYMIANIRKIILFNFLKGSEQKFHNFSLRPK